MDINILECGAVGDGVTSNTRAFQNAIVRMSERAEDDEK